MFNSLLLNYVFIIILSLGTIFYLVKRLRDIKRKRDIKYIPLRKTLLWIFIVGFSAFVITPVYIVLAAFLSS